MRGRHWRDRCAAAGKRRPRGGRCESAAVHVLGELTAALKFVRFVGAKSGVCLVGQHHRPCMNGVVEVPGGGCVFGGPEPAVATNSTLDIDRRRGLKRIVAPFIGWVEPQHLFRSKSTGRRTNRGAPCSRPRSSPARPALREALRQRKAPAARQIGCPRYVRGSGFRQRRRWTHRRMPLPPHSPSARRPPRARRTHRAATASPTCRSRRYAPPEDRCT